MATNGIIAQDQHSKARRCDQARFYTYTLVYMRTEPDQKRISQLQSFYRVQARLYDASRWSFLFGRRRLLEIVASIKTPETVLEVGCGTGTNLAFLARRFPGATLSGVDLSADMLRIAERKLCAWQTRVTLQQGAFNASIMSTLRPDLIVFSYSLSMMNPGWESALELAASQLPAGGLIAVVDFDSSPVALYRRFMHACHVRVDGHLLPALQQAFAVEFACQRRVYAGLWGYFMFIGHVPERASGERLIVPG
jgi:S-adenosylmethionine-diacylgycerolhomoserine-N-methlytransferase